MKQFFLDSFQALDRRNVECCFHFFSKAHTKKEENEEKTAWKISSRLSTRAMMMTTMNDKKDDDDVDEWRREKLISLI